VTRPEKIICVGQNYRDHLNEMGGVEVAEPTLFGKFAAVVVAPGEPIVLPRESTHVDAEAELPRPRPGRDLQLRPERQRDPCRLDAVRLRPRRRAGLSR